MNLKRLKVFFIGTCLLLASMGSVYLLRPLIRKPFHHVYQSSTAVYARGGELLRFTLSNDQKFRQWVKLENISLEIKTSFLESEDRYFYYHFGINPWSLIRATLSTYIFSGRRSGASTITMQLARKIDSLDSRYPLGKIQQIVSALKLELLYSKDEIFEAYLNLVPMGGNIEGVGAASMIFFKKRPSEVSWAEAMILAVIPQNPTKRTLLKGDTNELVSARLRLFPKVEALMPVWNKRLVNVKMKQASLKELPFHAPHFVLNALGRTSAEAEVRTTLDLPLQKMIEQRISTYLRSQINRAVKNASAVLINWQTTEVLSWVGSADFFDPKINGQVDGVVSQRSPGSTLKPFIYALAVEQGLIHPGTILKDSPRSFGAYDPENFDGDFKGPLSAEAALNQSRNLPAVELVGLLKERDFYQFLVDAKVGIPKNKDHYGPSIALGGYDLSLLELVELYALLAKSGEWIKANLLEQEIEKFKSQIPNRILTPAASYLVLDMLSRAELQTASYHKVARTHSLPISWKTGTSSGFRDAWTIGIFGPYVLGVWMGNFSGEPNRNFIGRELAAPLFLELVDTIRLQQKLNTYSAFVVPPSIVKQVSICPVSGKFPGLYCNHQVKINFIPGTSPIGYCDVHRQIWVSKRDGSLSCKPDRKLDMPRIHEFWPTDLLKIFADGGLARKQLPKAGPTCLSSSLYGSDLDHPPEIISPKMNVTYSLRSQRNSEKLIPLQANIDSSAKELFWFIDSEFVGRSEAKEIFLWPARSGEYHVKVVDDLGRSSSRKVSIKYVD
jgi:penicillin-binding protein 1C